MEQVKIIFLLFISVIFCFAKIQFSLENYQNKLKDMFPK
jgi:hypothetical protein